MAITRTNVDSHKRKKITAAVVKSENSNRMNAKRTNLIRKRSKTTPESEVVPISNPNKVIILIHDNEPVSINHIAESDTIVVAGASIDMNTNTGPTLLNTNVSSIIISDLSPPLISAIEVMLSTTKESVSTSNATTATNATSFEILPPPPRTIESPTYTSSNLPKNKTRAFYSVGKDKVNTSF